MTIHEYTCKNCRFLKITSYFSAECSKNRPLVMVWLPDSSKVVHPETEQGCVLKKLKEQING